MTDATIVAVVILGGVFLLMSLAIIKSGIDGAIKMWSVMGAITGVAFGAITSFYFSKEVNDLKVASVVSDKDHAYELLTSVSELAQEAKNSLTGSAKLLEHDGIYPTNHHVPEKISFPIEIDNKALILEDISNATSLLDSIQSLSIKVDSINKIE